MRHYPEVIGEQATIDLVRSGRSLARFGDGEFNLLRHRAALSQRSDRRLQARLAEILQDSGACAVGIPNIHRRDNAKFNSWQYFKWVSEFLSDRTYASAFISRPDSASWINTRGYWDSVRSIWTGRDVTLVYGYAETALLPSDVQGARSVREVPCPDRDAFASYDVILKQIGTPDMALLCLGPTATVLSVDLCAKGVHAVDVGHLGYFLRRATSGRPVSKMFAPEIKHHKHRTYRHQWAAFGAD
jgi:hypothetical protein